ncbi:MAG: PAS domain S-box protein [Candidatus Cloacimonetes bacterium]|nr:PAS domain S-box protein [Candidatus Cloacimonadota bacterium]
MTEKSDQKKKNAPEVRSDSGIELSVFRQFAQSSNLGFGMATVEGITEYVNPALCRMLEIDKEEILGESFIQFYPPDMQKKLKEEVIASVMKNGSWQGELSFKTKSGKMIHTFESYAVIYDEKGKPMFINDVIRDITELKRLQEIEIESIKSKQQQEAKQEKEKLLHNLNERLKEMSTLYQFEKIENNTDLSIVESLQKIAEILPAGFQFPDITEATVKYDNTYYTTEHYKKTYNYLEAPIIINNEEKGFVRVDYTKKVIPDRKNQFLDEEKKLIETIASNTANLIIRRESERRLAESEKKFREIVNALNDAIYNSDNQGKLTFVNQALCDIFGYKEDEILGKPFGMFIIPEAQEKFLIAYKDSFKNKKAHDVLEVPVIKKDGSKRVVEIKPTIIFEDGKPVGSLGIIRDITEQKEWEQKMRESEERYRSFVENFHGIAFRSKMDWTPIYFHGSVEEITGYTEAEFINGNPRWDQIIHKDDLKKLIAESSKKGIQKEGYIANRQYRIITKHGKTKWVLDYIKTVYDEVNGENILQGALYNITEQVNAQEKSVILDSTPTLVAYHDLKHEIIWANKTACESVQMELDEVVGKKCYEMWASRKKECENCPVRKSWETGEIVKGEMETPDGRYWMIYAGPVFDDKGKVIGAVETTLDITEQRVIGLELQHNQNMLRQIIDTVPSSIFIKDRDGKYLLVNSLMAEQHNTTPEELVGKYDYEIAQKWFEKVDYQEFRAREQKSIDSNTTLFIPEESFIHQDGTVRWSQTTKIPFELYDKEKCLLVISIDITNRKISEESLRIAKERYETAEESAHLGHWEMDIETGKSLWSDEFFRICGFEPGAFSPTEEIGMQSIHPDDRDKAAKAVEESIANKKPYAIEKRIVRPNGEIRWVHSIGKIICDKDEKPIKLQGSFLDITERKKAEKLQETFYKISNAVSTTDDIQDLYRRIQLYLGNIIDTTNFYIALYDSKKQYISFGYYADESFENPDHMPSGRPFGKGLTEYVLSTGKPLFATRQTQHELAEKGEIEVIGRLSEIWLGVPLCIDSGQIGVIAVQSYIDPNLYTKNDIEILNFVSQEIALAINRKQVEEKIKRELKEKELLLREIHHRTKNNLQTICGLLQLQEYSINSKEDAVKGFEASQDRIRAMSSAYEILLSSEYMSEVTLGEYITLLVEQIKKNYDIHNKVKLAFSLDEVSFETEKLSKLGLILNEIITNSIKYAFEDMEKGTVKLRLSQDEKNVILKISDNGGGIPKEIDLKNPKTLGLSLIDMLVYEFGGTYLLNINKGTSYTLNIPKHGRS